MARVIVLTDAETATGYRLAGVEVREADPDTAQDMLEELIGEGFADKIRYYPTTTRETSAKMGRITDLLRSGEVFSDMGIEPINPETDRAMICGNLAFNLELKELLEGYGLKEGANSDPQTYVVEKAFLD